MRLIMPVIYAAVLGAAVYVAVAQSPFPRAVASAPVDGLSTQAPDKPGAAVKVGKRETCRRAVTAKHLRRSEARDQMQLCVARARVDCLQQAIDQKFRGAARRVFVKSCVAA